VFVPYLPAPKTGGSFLGDYFNSISFGLSYSETKMSLSRVCDLNGYFLIGPSFT
jgi:hypothetical protein